MLRLNECNAGHTRVACWAIRTKNALQCLRRALHEAGEEEVGGLGMCGPASVETTPARLPAPASI